MHLHRAGTGFIIPRFSRFTGNAVSPPDSLTARLPLRARQAGRGKELFTALALGVAAAAAIFAPMGAAEAVQPAEIEQVSPGVFRQKREPVAPMHLQAAVRQEIHRLRQQEGFDTGFVPEEVLERRALYNLTRDGEVMSPYLPYRQTLRNSPVRLARYDSLVKELQDKATMLFSPKAFHRESRFADFAGERPADPSSRHMFAAIIVELFHNRPDLIRKVLDRPQNLKVVFSAAEANRDDGLFSNDPSNTIFLDFRRFWGWVADKQGGSTVGLHEFVHAVDAEGAPNSTDGLFSEMTPTRKKTFLEERERLFRGSKPMGTITIGGRSREITTTGLDTYAFKNGDEFLATTLELFYGRPELLRRASPTLYDVYRDFFKLDPLDGYRDTP